MASGSTLAAGQPPPSKGKQILVLAAVNMAALAMSPYILAKKISRVYRKHAPHELDWRRFVIAPMQRGVPLATKPGPRVVFLGPAFGEVRMIEALSRRLAERCPDANFIWSIRHLPTIELTKKAHPNQPIMITPLDNVLSVSLWARKVKPDVVVILEKFWIPNLLSVSKLAGAKVAIVNGRTNPKDRGSQLWKAGYYRWMAHNIDLFCMQTAGFVQQIRHLVRPGSRQVVTGNLKLDLQFAPLEQKRQDEIRAWLSTRGGLPLLAAGSTSGLEEEDFVLAAFLKAREVRPCALLLAPRVLLRLPEVLENLEKHGMKVSRRSQPSDELADVYLLDTLGELSFGYTFALGAFVGGTVKGTSHNVMEPVMLGLPVCYGPMRGHFEDLQLLCEQFAVGFRCFTSEEMSAHWVRVLTDDAFLDEIRARSEQFLQQEGGATDKTVDALVELILSVKRSKRRSGGRGPWL